MRKNRSRILTIAAFAVALSFGIRAYAEPPRDEVAHAYVLLKLAKHDYGGHKAEALKQLELAGRALGLDLHGGPSAHERQMKSDELVSEAAQFAHDAEEKLEARDRRRVADHLERAVHEIDAALRKK